MLGMGKIPIVFDGINGLGENDPGPAAGQKRSSTTVSRSWRRNSRPGAAGALLPTIAERETGHT